MTKRERGNVWPLISVAAGALVVLGIVPLVIHRQTASRMATVEAQVSIGDTSDSNSQGNNSLTYRWPNSEVPRTAERLRDVTAVAVASISYVIENTIARQPPRDGGEIIVAIAKRGLIPTEWLTSQPGVLQMPNGAVHLRYSRTRSIIEVVSVPKERTDGPAILIRVPDSENVGVGTRYFESTQLDGIIYPEPFEPIAQIIACGWQPRLFKQTPIPEKDRAQLEQWANAVSRK